MGRPCVGKEEKYSFLTPTPVKIFPKKGKSFLEDQFCWTKSSCVQTWDIAEKVFYVIQRKKNFPPKFFNPEKISGKNSAPLFTLCAT